jgi:hypothetical protein
MNLRHTFPIAIIDENYSGTGGASRGMRQLAAEIEKSGFRTVAGLSCEDGIRLATVFNNESCWLVSVDGSESSPTEWQVLEEMLATKRASNALNRLFTREPISLSMTRDNDNLRLVVDRSLSRFYRPPDFRTLYLQTFGRDDSRRDAVLSNKRRAGIGPASHKAVAVCVRADTRSTPNPIRSFQIHDGFLLFSSLSRHQQMI